jgi:hypothetical protein
MKAIEITKDAILVELSQKELNVLCNSLNEAMKGIEAWEFRIRTGIEVEDAETLLQALISCKEELK